MEDLQQINKNYRLISEPDQDAENPRDWYNMTGALTVNGDSRRIDVKSDYELDGLSAAWTAFQDEDVVIRWAKIFHGITLEHINGTFWWVEPSQLDQFRVTEGIGAGLYRYGGSLLNRAELERSIIHAEQSIYEQWGEGSVYVVALERRVRRREVTKHGHVVTDSPVVESWEEVDSIGGIYDGEYGSTLLDVAREHFDLASYGIKDPASKASADQGQSSVTTQP